ncbi:carboxyvinyl-carboxyphosphonate phosphorylmutase [Streptomyces daqingensis]|uniref:Carboxyvinyl-carboxyphosphonate phosphorylmutase n=1 Tax=Streptomyces daqingensis TaxID=1472640 RepID=A0ABQ2MHL4_9ACTN|nr:isocitrate lyase/phosphoenolpyruvate mutase family protein [Streptomyces daqingensis]GGO52417.1 carboxyvinyl-carboxyphosphonate phosphorylmutase [Streptomyces daqingensis]
MTAAGQDSGVERLRALHRGRASGDPLVLPGPWDAASAQIFAEAGFEALATPSHGVAASLGHADGETPADEMFAAVGRIVRAVAVPVTADIERGYGLAPGRIVERLLDAGAVGCNLEDSEDGRMVGTEEQAGFLSEVIRAAEGRLLVNARIDSYLRPVEDPLADALERGRLYVEAGAECLYPIGAPPADIPVLARELSGPLNVLATRDGPTPHELGTAGATRITFGGGLMERASDAVRDMARELRGV